MSRAVNAENETRAALRIRAFASAVLLEQWPVGQPADFEGVWLWTLPSKVSASPALANRKPSRSRCVVG